MEGEELFLEFLPDGRLAYTGLFGEDTKEFMEIRHPLDYGKPMDTPRWELRGDLLVMRLKTAKEFRFHFAFSEDNSALSLQSLQSKAELTFYRKTQ